MVQPPRQSEGKCEPPELNAGTRQWRRGLFRVAAVALALLPFVLLEGLLTALDVGRPAESDDPFVGFSRSRPLFELDAETDTYRTSRSRLLNFEVQEFPAKKPADEFRIFCLGGSTVRGRPFETLTAFSAWLALELNERDSTRHYRSINCGGLSYASYRLRPMLDEVLNYDPDLIVIATGHNEYLEDRTYHGLKHRSSLRQWVEDRVYNLRSVSLLRRVVGQKKKTSKTVLPDDVDPRLDHASGYSSYHRDDAWRAGVVDHFELSLRVMIQACRKANTPLILVALDSNLRDCPPFKSEHRPDLDPSDEATWQAAFDRGSSLEEDQPEAALAAYHEAESIDDQFALLAYRIARCLDRLNRLDEARRYYIQARQWDICPLRAVNEIRDRFTMVASETSTPLIDARQVLKTNTSIDIPGYETYLDHVHPTIGAHQQIARRIVAEMQHLGLWKTDSDWNDDARRQAYRAYRDTLAANYLTNGARRIVWLEHWARRNRLLSETLPRTTDEYLRLGHRLWDLGRFDEAIGTYRQSIDLDASVTMDLLDHVWQLADEGRLDEAIHLATCWKTLAAWPDAAKRELALAQLVLECIRSDVIESFDSTEVSSDAQTEARMNRWLLLRNDSWAASANGGGKGTGTFFGGKYQPEQRDSSPKNEPVPGL